MNAAQSYDILNAISDSGICIVREQDGKVLFSNNRMKEMKVDYWRGGGFYGTFNTREFQQLLREIDESPTHSTEFFDVYSRNSFSIAVNKIDVDGKPAMLIRLTPTRDRPGTEDTLLVNRQLLDTFIRIYPMILTINLSKNSYAMMLESGNFFGRMAGNFGVYDDLISIGASIMHPSHRAAFLERFSRETVLKNYANGATGDYFEGQFLADTGNYYWMALHVMRIENPSSDDIMEFAFLRIIDDLKQIEERIEQVQLEADWYRAAVMRTYDRIYEIVPSKDAVYDVSLSGGGIKRERLPYTADEFNKLMVFDRMHPDIRKAVFPKMMNLFATSGETDGYGKNKNGEYYDELLMLGEDDEYHWEGSYTVFDNSGNGNFLIFVKNIDEVKEREARQKAILSEALYTEQRANRAKREFLQNMSHDIRTPMNAILGYTAIAKTVAGNPERTDELLSKIEASSEHLLDLINEVLDMSRIESGEMVLAEEDIDLGELVDSLCLAVQPQIKKKHQTLKLDISRLDRRKVLGDRVRLEQMLLNVLSNAVKYTDDGGEIELSLRAIRESTDGMTKLTVEISDNGIGMTPDFKERIFLPFERDTLPEVRAREGTGLGLSISKRIVDSMNGSISVESKLGEGSTFKIELALRLAKESVAEAPKHDREGAQICYGRYEGKRFLLVDDNEMNREIGEELLGMLGAEIVLASSGDEAIDILNSSEPYGFDLVFMDIQMPIKDGYETVREIRASSREDVKRMLVFAMTANAFAEDIRRSIQAGMNEHISKPLDLGLLCSVLEKYFK